MTPEAHPISNQVKANVLILSFCYVSLSLKNLCAVNTLGTLSLTSVLLSITGNYRVCLILHGAKLAASFGKKRG